MPLRASGEAPSALLRGSRRSPYHLGERWFNPIVGPPGVLLVERLAQALRGLLCGSSFVFETNNGSGRDMSRSSGRAACDRGRIIGERKAR